MSAVQVCIIDEVSLAQHIAAALARSTRETYVVTTAEAITPELIARFQAHEFHVCFVPQVTLLAHLALRLCPAIVIADDDERTRDAALASGASACLARADLTPYVLDLAVRYTIKTRQQLISIQGAYRKLQRDYHALQEQVEHLRDRLSQYEEVTGRITLPPEWPPK